MITASASPLRRFPFDQSETSKSRWLSSTQLEIEALQRSRSAFPYLIPLTVQFTPPGDTGTTRSTITPTKALHSGLLFLTASAIANSRAACVIKVRPTGFSSPLFGLIFVPRILGNPALNLTNLCAKLIRGFARVRLRRISFDRRINCTRCQWFRCSQNRAVVFIVDRRAPPENARASLIHLLLIEKPGAFWPADRKLNAHP
jgi:hypothetical protein